MGKQKSSSASSATRKKHARKAQGHKGEDDSTGTTPQSSTSKGNQPKGTGVSGKGKGKKKAEPRVKMYIPPVKPAALQKDPVDKLSLAGVLDPELLVVLRKLAKRDGITKRRALEELVGWIGRCESEAAEEREAALDGLQVALPAWNMHFPALTLHPSRRIRLLATTIQTLILSIPTLREQLWISLYTTIPYLLEPYYGAWLLSTCDIDRQVSQSAQATWRSAVEHVRTRDPEDGYALHEFVTNLEIFIHHAMMGPEQVYLQWYPWAAQPTGHSMELSQGKPAPKRDPGTEADERTRAEGDEENANDRNGRIRAGALGALRWLIDDSTTLLTSQDATEDNPVDSLLADPEFWSILYPGTRPPFVTSPNDEGDQGRSDEGSFESFGKNQTAVRRGGWSLVHTLAKNHPERIKGCTPVISAAILRSIWIEPDSGVRLGARDGLLTFLTNVKDAWSLASSYKHDDSSSDEEEKESEEVAAIPESAAYKEFLQFLRLACGGTVVQFYPTLVVIISTIPREILPLTQTALEELFEAFWAAVDGHALTVLERGSTPIMAFITSLLETLVVLLRNLPAPSQDVMSNDIATNVSVAQIGRIWEYFLSSKLSPYPEEFGSVMGKNLGRLQGIPHWEKRTYVTKGGVKVECSTVYWAVWSGIHEKILDAYGTLPSQEEKSIDLTSAWREMERVMEGPAKEAHHELLREVMEPSLDRLVSGQKYAAQHLEIVKFMLEEMGTIVKQNEHLKQKVYHVFEDDLSMLSTHLSPGEYTKLVKACLHFLLEEPARRQSQWTRVLSLAGRTDADALQKNMTILQKLLDMGRSGELKNLQPGEELSLIMTMLLENIEQNGHRNLLEGLIQQHDHFIPFNQLQACANQLVGALEETSSNVLRLPNYHIPSSAIAAGELLTVMQEKTSEVVEPLLSTLSAPVFVLRHVAPLMDTTVRTSAFKKLFDRVEESEESLDALWEEVRSWILDLDVYASSETLITAVTSTNIEDSAYILKNIVPSQQAIESLFLEEIQTSTNPILAAIDILVPEVEFDDAVQSEDRAFDKQHLSYYARSTWALAILASTDRQLAKDNIWILKHALLLQQMAEDRLFAPASGFGCFGPDIEEKLLKRVIESVQKLNTYIFSGVSSFDLPHNTLIQAITSPSATASLQTAEQFIVDLCKNGKSNDCSRLARIIRSVLSHTLRGASATNIDLWISLARTLRRTSPHTGLAVISAAVASGVETPLLSRLRNEVASDISGMSPSRADEEGARSLQTLLLLAPLPDSDVGFLPPQRAINLVQAVEKWIASDEDLEPDIESRMIALFYHIAPILQSLSGSHWDFAFDLVENTLENSSFTDSDSLVALSRSLDFVMIIQGLVLTNKQLNAAWSTRRVTIQRLVRDLVSSPQSISIVDLLPSLCRSKSLGILQGSGNGVLEAESFSKLVPLLQIPILETQRDAYGLVSTASKMYTEKIVVEVGVNVSEEITARLPSELMELLAINGLWDEEFTESAQSPAQFTFLLAWMAVFDAFDDTSLRVRSSYVEQLRNGQVIQRNLIPALCNLLNIGKPGIKPYKLDMWEIETFFVPLYEPSSLRVLAAHIYYRALRAIPSLVRTWWTDCKDRQLSNAFAAYTAMYFSPILVSAELSNVRDPTASGGREKLEDESVTIKIAQATSEVSLAYAVDDQQLEMAVKMPAEYPLKLVEVRDVRRVGVAEDKWRGWLFAVQQIISTQNGHITDALALFKKNVTLHFQGQVECAICYSIISVTDLQLPTKPCKTCKNRFHASCLYKWFKSSSSSSCPLCRSDIF